MGVPVIYNGHYSQKQRCEYDGVDNDSTQQPRMLFYMHILTSSHLYGEHIVRSEHATPEANKKKQKAIVYAFNTLHKTDQVDV